MSSFLSAAENVVRQRQNVRRDLKKKRKKAELLSWRWKIIICFFFFFFFFWFVLYRKDVLMTVRQLYLYFWNHYDAVDAR